VLSNDSSGRYAHARFRLPAHCPRRAVRLPARSVGGRRKIAALHVRGANPVGRVPLRQRRVRGRVWPALHGCIQSASHTVRNRVERYRSVRVRACRRSWPARSAISAYDMVALIERIPTRLATKLRMDDAVMMVLSRARRIRSRRHGVVDCADVFTRREGRPRLQIQCGRARNSRHAQARWTNRSARSIRTPPVQAAQVHPNFTRARFLDAVRSEGIHRAGDIFPSGGQPRFAARRTPIRLRFTAPCASSIFAVYVFSELNGRAVVEARREMLTTRRRGKSQTDRRPSSRQTVG